jgi:hypothetical protein
MAAVVQVQERMGDIVPDGRQEDRMVRHRDVHKAAVRLLPDHSYDTDYQQEGAPSTDHVGVGTVVVVLGRGAAAP